MNINDYIGYKLICVISKDYKDEPYYSEEEFEITISKDSNKESGYKALVTSHKEEGRTTDEWDAGIVGENLMFGSWKIKRKEKI